jgi:ribosomal protein L31E
MTRYTVNLSRARAAGGKERAKKAVSILQNKLEKKEGEVRLSTEVNKEIWSRGAAKPPAKISVKVEEKDGEKKAYPVETKEKQNKPSSSSSSHDYSEVVSGTIGEAKDAINEMASPDYEALLEAEKNGKDRKTLKDWIEAQQ